jgi:hypothetical protein
MAINRLKAWQTEASGNRNDAHDETGLLLFSKTWFSDSFRLISKQVTKNDDFVCCFVWLQTWPLTPMEVHLSRFGESRYISMLSFLLDFTGKTSKL